MTEKELLNKQKAQLYGIQKVLLTSQLTLDDITELIPGVVHLNRINTLELTYLDKRSRELLEVTNEEVVNNGKKVLNNIVKPESFKEAKKLFGAMDFKDPSVVVSHFQAIRYLAATDS